jgi:hypothetical protein
MVCKDYNVTTVVDYDNGHDRVERRRHCAEHVTPVLPQTRLRALPQTHTYQPYHASDDALVVVAFTLTSSTHR